ncbi:hypothetical protein ACWENR_23015 [Micromonospora sp. NPDC004336]
MRRVVLDCNGVDPIVDLPGALDVMKAAISAGKLKLIGTHVLAEEVEATPDPQRRAELQQLVRLAEVVPTGAFIFDVSRFDQARLGGDTEAVERLLGGNPAKNSRDALIAVTSLVDGCALVTSDKRLRREASALGVEVLHARELLAELGYEVAS